MSEKPENPPAFPTREFRGGKYLGEYPLQSGEIIKQYEADHWAEIQGMSLRDYFAAKALQAMLGNEYLQRAFAADIKAQKKSLGLPDRAPEIDARNNQEWHATSAYQFADAMLKERENTNENN